MAKKKSFVMYMSWAPLFTSEKDPVKVAGLIQAIYKYQETGEEPEQDNSIYPLFLMIKGTLEEDEQKYQSKCERLKSNRNHHDISMKSDRNQDDISGVTSESLSYSDPDTDSLPDKKPKEPKETYGESGNVKLTIREYERLVEEYGSDLTQKAIEYLDWYIADKGYKSKSNYSAIRRWVIDAVKERGRASPEKFDMDAFLIETIREESG